MNVYLNKVGPNGALAHHTQKQGDQVVSDPLDAQVFIPEFTRVPFDWVKQDFENYSPEKVCYYLTRIFDGEQFLQQWMLGIPLVGLMNSGLGVACEVGSVVAYCQPRSELQILAASGALQPVLKETSYRGFVSWQFGQSNELLNVSFGVPSYGMYAMFEGLSQSIAGFFLNPLQLKESWTCSVLLSRSPWPHKLQAQEILIGPIADPIQKHLWLYLDNDCEFDGSVVRTSHTRLAVATAYSLGGPHGPLHDLTYRALPAPRKLEIPEKQFRSDLVQVTERVLAPLLSSDLITMRVPLSDFLSSQVNHSSPSNNFTPNLPTILKGVEDDLKIEVGELTVDDPK